jgi:hypothetical protein
MVEGVYGRRVQCDMGAQASIREAHPLPVSSMAGQRANPHTAFLTHHGHLGT